MQRKGGTEHSKDTMPQIPPTRPAITLIMRQGPEPGRQFFFSKEAISIGRLGDNDLVIDDPQISRHHASLAWEDGRFILRDLGSANGTFLNGQQITAPQELQSGDVIGVSEVLLAFRALVPGEGDQTLVMPELVKQQARRAAARALGVEEAPSGLSWWPIALVLVLVLAIASASLWFGLGGPRFVPTVTIDSPPTETEVKAGEELAIMSTATDKKGVTKVELWVNDVLYRTDDSPDPQGQPAFSVRQTWVPADAGSYNLKVKAYNVDGGVSEPASIMVKVAPAPTPVPAATECTLDATFVADVTIPEGTVIDAGERIDKTWRLKNSGTCPWEAGYQLVFKRGDQMNSPDFQAVPSAAPGQEVNIGVTMKAPWSPGTYTGIWQMKSPSGEYFGDEIKVVIKVEEPPQLPQPKPTLPSG